MLNISKDKKRYSEIELDLHKKLAYEKGRASIIKEFEKIKAEIIACTQEEEGEVPACINYGLNLSIEIIDNHIAELKGEQE